jgi:tight adherence protein B
MTSTLIAIAAGIGVAALVAGVAMMIRSPEAENVEDRLDALAGMARKPNLVVADTSVLSRPLDDVPGQLEAMLLRFFNLRLLMEQADVDMSIAKFLGICAGLAGVGAAIIFVSGLNLALAPVVGGCLAFLPLLWLLLARRKRKKAFAAQLPAALELMARGLRAGHSLAAGFQLVGDEMTDPIGSEFTRVFEEQNLGVPLEEAMQTMTDRIPNLDLKFFATAVVLQRQTGGDLAEILDKIGSLIRERFKIFGQIQALTGEGRLSGIVLLALPPVLLGVMLKLNYEYAMTLFHDPMGKQMLMFAIILQIVGALVIKKIVNIKV